jgi:hypothetical protein
MKSKIRPLKRSNNLRLLTDEIRVNCAVELVERRKNNPDLSINQLFNDLISIGLSVTHHPIEKNKAVQE